MDILGSYKCLFNLSLVGRKPANSREIPDLSHQQSSWMVPVEQGSKECLKSKKGSDDPFLC